MQLWTSEGIKPLSEIKIWLTIIIFYYFCNQHWSPLKCHFIFIISFGYLTVMYCLWNGNGIYCIDKIKHLESFKNLVKNVSNWHINDSVFHTFLSKNLLSIFFGIFYLSIHIRVYTVMYCLWNAEIAMMESNFGGTNTV